MFIESYIKYIRYELNFSAYTVLSYGNDLRQFESFLTGGKDVLDVASVTSSDIRAWMVHLVEGGDAASTVKRKLQALRSFYKYLLKRGVVKENPTQEVEMAKASKRLPDCMRVHNVEGLLDDGGVCRSFEEMRDKLILLMLYSTGIRRSELIGLRDADVSVNELKVRGKRNKDRIIPFGAELHDAIMQYRKLRDASVSVGSEWFFVRKNGEQLYPTLVYRLVYERLSVVGGGSRFSPHVLRHTFASVMLNDGAQLNSVKEILGHESLAATQVYTHITYSELKSNYEHAHPRALKKGG